MIKILKKSHKIPKVNIIRNYNKIPDIKKSLNDMSLEELTELEKNISEFNEIQKEKNRKKNEDASKKFSGIHLISALLFSFVLFFSYLHTRDLILMDFLKETNEETAKMLGGEILKLKREIRELNEQIALLESQNLKK